MSVFRKANFECKITRKNNAPLDNGFDADLKEVLTDKEGKPRGICAGMTVSWIVGVLHGYADAVNTTGFKNYFDNVLRFQGAYAQAHKPTVDRDERTVDFKMRKLSEMRAHNCSQYATGFFTVSKLHEMLQDHGGKDLWAAYISMFKHAIGIAKANGQLHAMDPNYGLFTYQQTRKQKTQVDNFCADLGAHITHRIQDIVKGRTNRQMEVTPASAFEVTFWERRQ